MSWEDKLSHTSNDEIGTLKFQILFQEEDEKNVGVG